MMAKKGLSSLKSSAHAFFSTTYMHEKKIHAHWYTCCKTTLKNK